MSDENDFTEVANQPESPTPIFDRGPRLVRQVTLESTIQEYQQKKLDLVPGERCQYALVSDGYKTSTATVPTLPPGCYDITADPQIGVYVKPAPPPTGLLLELPEMRSEAVLSQVETFWNSEKDYKQGNEFVVGGALFKAGIILFGPPGSGKSCTIKLVSKKIIERGGTVFYGSLPYVTNSWLVQFAQVEPNRKCVVILEDIDSLIDNHGEAGYLDMLDSAHTINNVLFIATTNYPERLDKRVYNRPGRFSHVMKIGLPTAKTREAYLKAILKNHRDVAQIVDNTNGFTIDHLTALTNAVYREKKELLPEIERLKSLFNVPKSSEAQVMGFGLGDNDDK